MEGFTDIFAAVIDSEASYPAAFPLKSHFKSLEALENVIFVFDGIDVGNAGEVVLKGDKVLAPIETYGGDGATNVAVNELYWVLTRRDLILMGGRLMSALNTAFASKLLINFLGEVNSGCHLG